MLDHIRRGGRPITPFCSAPSGPCVILRHDIDFSIGKAFEMATIDCEAGARSTFFVLLTAPYYNALSARNLQLLRRIAAMGHEIGLHYDSSIVEDLESAEQSSRVASLARCLEEQLGLPVMSVAQHKPARARVRPVVPGFVDVRSDGFCREMAYLSDSRMKFGTDDVYAFLDSHPRVQLAIHPIWWNGAPRTREEILESVETIAAAEIASNARADLAAIHQYLGQHRP
jgi:hypothetical protein